jgi:hypothetical protein
MKKNFFVFLLILPGTSSFHVYAQTKAPVKTEREVRDLICFKWKITSAELEGRN